MSVLEKLLAFTGNWQGTNALWLSPQEPARKSCFNAVTRSGS